MKLKKLATSTIASILLFGSVGQLAISAKPASANHPHNNLELTTKSGTSEALLVPGNFDTAHNANADKAELVNINFKHRFRGRRRRSFRRFGRYNSRRHLKFDNTFSTGNSVDEKIIRVRLF